MKRAIITGITGQDGSYLAELLLEKGYEVHGIVRRSSSFNTERIDPIYKDRHEHDVKLFLHHGDLTDSSRLVRLLYELRPDEVYHLGAQSHVRVSFDVPEYTTDVTGMGTVRILEAMRDAAEGIVTAAERYDKSDPVNLGAGFEIKIRDLVPLVARLCRFEGEIVWDTSKPNGQPRRMLDTSRALREFGWRARIGFEEGLRETIAWFESHRGEIK